jgi:hypothetical protein
MITITKQENRVYNQIKLLQMEYDEGVSENILRMDLGLSEHQFKDVFEELDEKELIIRIENGKIKAQNRDDEIKVVDTRKEVNKAELNQIEIDAVQIIKNLAIESDLIPRYTLEGSLLYGKLKVSTFRMYHIIISLENKGIIKKVLKSDGEYYKFTDIP